jgi:flagellar biogenesis protein FliO
LNRSFTAFALLLVWLSAAAAQQPAVDAEGALVQPRMTPLAVSEPQPFPPAGQAEARPISAVPQQPHGSQSITSWAQPETGRLRYQPPVNFRLASASEPAKETLEKLPLRLAPRSSAAHEPVARPAPSATTAVTTVAASLATVLGIFVAIAWCTRRLNGGGAMPLPKEALEILGRAPLAGRQQMQLVRVGRKLVLLAVSPGGAEPLTEINDPAEVEHLLGLCHRGQSASATAAFREALQQLSAEPAQQGFVGGTKVRGRR